MYFLFLQREGVDRPFPSLTFSSQTSYTREKIAFYFLVFGEIDPDRDWISSVVHNEEHRSLRSLTEGAPVGLGCAHAIL